MNPVQRKEVFSSNPCSSSRNILIVQYISSVHNFGLNIMTRCAILLCCLFLHLINLIVTEDTPMVDFVWEVRETDLLAKRNGEMMYSPEFRTYNDSVEHSWMLRLSPHGRKPDDEENCSLSLCYNGQAVVETKYQLYLNNKFNRYTHGGLTSDIFPGDEHRCWGYDHFISRQVVLDKAKGYLFGDKVKVGVRIQSDPIRMSNVEEYSSVLTKSLNRQRVVGKYTDLTLNNSRGVWKAHKVIVSSQSALFDEKLSNATDKYPIRIVISDEYCADLGSTLEFVYTGSVNNISESVNDLVNCAHNLKIYSLKSYCEDELLNNITCENLLDRFILSHRYQLPTLKAALMNYVSQTKCSAIRYDLKEKMKNFPDLLLEITSFLLNK